ncbi:MAG: hypothetical protein JO300_08700 [Silvibacterium sp.]|nr:hypothetical protein [Silvibacterium sp.]MBV8437197.1 hypothetical protein [Silvibacterium sp.]
MARGWESKSVEEQVSQELPASQSALNPKQQADAAQAGELRRRQALELQRERILDERTSSPVRRAALAAALAQIEEQLKQYQ